MEPSKCLLTAVSLLKTGLGHGRTNATSDPCHIFSVVNPFRYVKERDTSLDWFSILCVPQNITGVHIVWILIFIKMNEVFKMIFSTIEYRESNCNGATCSLSAFHVRPPLTLNHTSCDTHAPPQPLFLVYSHKHTTHSPCVCVITNTSH